MNFKFFCILSLDFFCYHCCGKEIPSVIELTKNKKICFFPKIVYHKILICCIYPLVTMQIICIIFTLCLIPSEPTNKLKLILKNAWGFAGNRNYLFNLHRSYTRVSYVICHFTDEVSKDRRLLSEWLCIKIYSMDFVYMVRCLVDYSNFKGLRKLSEICDMKNSQRTHILWVCENRNWLIMSRLRMKQFLMWTWFLL